MRVIVKPLLFSSSYINKVDSSDTPKNLLYLRENRSVLLAGKYKPAYILASLGNKNPPILGGKALPAISFYTYSSLIIFLNLLNLILSNGFIKPLAT